MNDINGKLFSTGIIENFVSAPTHALAMKWLREEHNLFISLYPQRSCIEWDIYKNNALIAAKEEQTTYEDACEAAIQYCLKNLI